MTHPVLYFTVVSIQLFVSLAYSPNVSITILLSDLFAPGLRKTKCYCIESCKLMLDVMRTVRNSSTASPVGIISLQIVSLVHFIKIIRVNNKQCSSRRAGRTLTNREEREGDAFTSVLDVSLFWREDELVDSSSSPFHYASS
ncbi:hypothetical protein WUBG_04604 [Wuchereria bancrofti]|uniref:Uncharacterized protein n=1 Tax=Wuchereria bancrofti TaxID=6293 RepID=J9FAU2_WUCBA|nr:hypothetical protein WUBG_04604 [Wuchereria bancrofti]